MFRLGRVKKGVHCSVLNCDEEAVRSLSSQKVSSTDFKIEDRRRIYLCEKHYKTYKKKTKKDRRIESWRRVKSIKSGVNYLSKNI